MTNNMQARLAVDIGGTFTDVVLETGRRAPRRQGADHAATRRNAAVLDGVRTVLAEAGWRRATSALVVHGTTSPPTR